MRRHLALIVGTMALLIPAAANAASKHPTELTWRRAYVAVHRYEHGGRASPVEVNCDRQLSPTEWECLVTRHGEEGEEGAVYELVKHRRHSQYAWRYHGIVIVTLDVETDELSFQSMPG